MAEEKNKLKIRAHNKIKQQEIREAIKATRLAKAQKQDNPSKE